MQRAEDEEDEAEGVRYNLKKRVIVDLVIPKYCCVVRAHTDVTVEHVSGKK